MGSIVAGIAKEMSEIITDNDIDLESLDYDEIEEQFDIIKGHAILLTKENEELKKENEELKEQIYGIHDDEMDANGLLDDITKLKKKIEDLNRICLGAICWDAVEVVTKDNMKLQDEIEQLKDRGDICEEIAKLKEELEVEKDGRDHDVQQFQETLSENGSLETEVEDLKEICMGMCKQLEDVTKHEISDPDHYYRGIKAVEELKEEIEGERLTQLLTLKVVKDKEEENKKLKGANEIIEKLRDWYGEGGFMGTAMDQRFMNIINPPESEEEEEN